MALFGIKLVFQKVILNPLSPQQEAGMPASHSTFWYTREAEQSLGHRLQWFSELHWPQKNVFCLWSEE